MSQFLLKRAYDPADDADGARFLVDRLWPRGLRKEVLGAVWLREAAPSPALRKAWHAAPDAEWEHFAELYLAELRAADDHGVGEMAAALNTLRSASAEGSVTLVYAAKDPERNHAAVLRGYLED